MAGTGVTLKAFSVPSRWLMLASSRTSAGPVSWTAPVCFVHVAWATSECGIWVPGGSISKGPVEAMLSFMTYPSKSHSCHFHYPLRPTQIKGGSIEGHGHRVRRTCGMEIVVAMFGKYYLSQWMSSVALESSHKRSFDVPFAFFSHIWEIHVYRVAFLH